MKIFVTAKPNSNRTEVQKLTEDNYIVSVKEAPVKGQANRAILKALADYFDVSILKVRMIHGHTTRKKVIEIVK